MKPKRGVQSFLDLEAVETEDGKMLNNLKLVNNRDISALDDSADDSESTSEETNSGAGNQNTTSEEDNWITRLSRDFVMKKWICIYLDSLFS